MNRGHYVILWSQGKMMRGSESVGLRVVGVGVEGAAVRAAPQASLVFSNSLYCLNVTSLDRISQLDDILLNVLHF